MATNKNQGQIGNDLPFEIDYVFPYVDNNDKVWQNQHAEMCKIYHKEYNPNNVRYRDYGTLQYVFRCIETNAPWIRKIYMIVEQESQVPSWLNKDKVNVIYHRDFIPKDLLPTYNSTTIEMFLHQISGLADHFLYANDDMYIINKVKKSDFFTEDGKPKFIMNKIDCHLDHTTLYRQHIRNGNELCCKDLHLQMPKNCIYKSDHGIAPVCKQTCKYLIEKYYNFIIKNCSAFRSSTNINQELYKSYQYLSKQYSKNVSFTMNYIEIDKIPSMDWLHKWMNNSKTIVLNDGTFKGKLDQWDSVNKIILSEFKRRLPNKSKYEN